MATNPPKKPISKPAPAAAEPEGTEEQLDDELEAVSTETAETSSEPEGDEADLISGEGPRGFTSPEKNTPNPNYIWPN